MSLSFQVLGNPGQDNALLVTVDTGQRVHRLLFDCGERCLDSLKFAEIQAIDHLLFSHLHMDHVGGFDTFFRSNYCRDSKPNHIWGPPRTAEILQGRFRGYWWNLHAGLPGTWRVHDLWPDEVRTYRLELSEAFSGLHEEHHRLREADILESPDYRVQALSLNHHGPSIAYRVREAPRQNLEMHKVQERGLSPGPWMQALKGNMPDSTVVEVGGKSHSLAELRAEFLRVTPGQSIAYLTDFLLDEPTHERLADWLAGCDTIICEAQYAPADVELAVRNHHTTIEQGAKLARAAGAGQLVLFHLSDRYLRPEWSQMLGEARALFPATRFPAHWNLSDDPA